MPENLVGTLCYLAALAAGLRRIGLAGIYKADGSAYYGAAFDWFALLALPLAAGLSDAVSALVVTRLERGRSRDARRVVFTALGSGIVLALFLGGGFFFGADFLAQRFLHLNLSSMALRAMLPALLLIVVLSVLSGGLDGFGCLSASGLIRIVFFGALFLGGPLLTEPLMQYGQKVGALLQNEQYGPAYGALGAGASVLLASLIGAIVAVITWLWNRSVVSSRPDAVQNGMGVREKRGQLVLSIMDHALPVWFPLLFLSLTGVVQTCFYFAARTEETGENAVRSFGAYAGNVLPLLALPCFLLIAFARHMIPGVRVSFAQRNLRKFRERCMLSLRCCTLLSVPFAVFYLIMAEPLLDACGRELYTQPLGGVLRIGGLCLLLFGIAAVWGAILLGMDRLPGLLLCTVAGFALYVAVLRVLLVTLRMDLYGIVISHLILFLLLSMILGVFVCRQGRIRVNWFRVLLAPLISGAIMAGVCALLGRLLLSGAPAFVNAFVTGIVGFLVYFVVTVLLRGATARELQTFPGGDALILFARTIGIMR